MGAQKKSQEKDEGNRDNAEQHDDNGQQKAFSRTLKLNRRTVHNGRVYRGGVEKSRANALRDAPRLG